MRHRLTLLLAALLLAGTAGAIAPSPLRVAANESCSQAPDSSYTNNGTSWDCNWSQIDNTNWPAGSQDPDCHNVCDWYVGGYKHGNCQWYDWTDNVNWYPNGVDLNAAADKAIKAWSSQPYCSPGWVKCQGCSGDMLTVQANNENNSNLCGEGWVTTAWQAYGATNDNHVVSSTLEYNTGAGATWYPNQPTQSGFYCDATTIALHEGGHAMTEGHASINNQDIMYWGGGEMQSIDGDAQAMLDSVYGPYHSNNNSPNGGCSGCQMACPQTSMVTNTTGTPDVIGTANDALWTACGTSGPYIDGYYAKLWDLSQGVPVPNAAWYVTEEERAVCITYLATKQLIPWVNCLTGGIQ